MRRLAAYSRLACLLSCWLLALWSSACDETEVVKHPTQIMLEIDSEDTALLEALSWVVGTVADSFAQPVPRGIAAE